MPQTLEFTKNMPKHIEEPLTLEEILDAENVADLLDDHDLTTLGQEVVRDFEADDSSREEWLQMMNDAIKLAMQYRERKTFPHEHAANVKYPLLTEAALEFHGRAYPDLINTRDLVKAKVIGYDPEGAKLKRGNRVKRHMQYQLTEEMPEWEEEYDLGFVILPIIGSLFKKTYYDPIEGRNMSPLVMPQDVVVNYGCKRIEDADCVTQVLYQSNNEVIENIRMGIYRDVELTQPSSESRDQTADDVTGHRPSYLGTEADHIFLESHRYADLDGDGYKEPYIVTVHKETGKVVRIVPRFEDDEIETDEFGNLIRIEPINYWTLVPFIPNPSGGFYPVGFGILLGASNEVVNTAINQLMDAGTWASTNTGFISKNLRGAKGGNIRMRPNEYQVVNASADDIRKGIVSLPVTQPSPVLFQLLSLMIDSGNRIASVTDLNQGISPGQNQPLGTTEHMLEQGQKLYNGIYKRVHRAIGKEFKKLFKLNSKYLDDTNYTLVLDPAKAEAEGITVRADYDMSQLNLVPSADPNASAKMQKIAQARDLIQLKQQGAPINVNVPFKMLIEAGDYDNLEELFNVPEPPPDPELVLKQKQQDHIEAIDWARLQVDLLKAKGNVLRDEASAMKTIAEAEGVEPGRQLDEYRQFYQELVDSNNAIQAEQKMALDFIKEQMKQQQATQGGSTSGSGTNAGGAG